MRANHFSWFHVTLNRLSHPGAPFSHIFGSAEPLTNLNNSGNYRYQCLVPDFIYLFIINLFIVPDFNGKSISVYFFFKFIYFERQRERESAGASRGEAGRESQAVFTLSAQSPMQGSNSRTMRSWPEPKSRVRCLTDWATQAPCVFTVLRDFFFLVFGK